MDIYVREKEFVDKEKNSKVKYNEFYIKFCVEIEKVEEIEISLKFDEKHTMTKSLLKECLDDASFDIITKETENGVRYNPVVTFPVGKKVYEVPVKLTTSDVTLVRIGIAQGIQLSF